MERPQKSREAFLGDPVSQLAHHPLLGEDQVEGMLRPVSRERSAAPQGVKSSLSLSPSLGRSPYQTDSTPEQHMLVAGGDPGPTRSGAARADGEVRT